jgi:pimeloyl-ACP methyl ester carboxylesterase
MEPSIHRTTWGTSGPRVVLVHGSVQGSSVGGTSHFSAQEKLAVQGWRLTVPDRPGHGRSPEPGRPDDAQADGAWVADMLEDGGHLVGHSFGGCVALAAAVRRPSTVRSLTLIEPAMQRVASSDPRVKKFLLQMAMIAIFSLSMASRAKKFTKFLGIPDEIRGGSSADEMARVGRAMLRVKLPTKAALEHQLAEVQRHKIPLLIVTGGWNSAFEAVGDTVARLGNGERMVISSPHHFPHLISDEFNTALTAFMQKIESSSQRAGAASA